MAAGTRNRFLPQSSEEQCPNCLQHQAEIQKWLPVEDILQIEMRLFFRGMLIPKPVNLSEARDAGKNLQSLSLPLRVIFNPFGRFGARTDQRHIAVQHVPQLRQFRHAPSENIFS